MTVHLILADGEVIVRARAEGPAGQLGDLIRIVRPGETVLGYSYEELRALGDGAHDLSGIRGQKSEVRSQKSEVRSQKSEVRVNSSF